MQNQRNAEDFRLWIFLYRACESGYLEVVWLDGDFGIQINVSNSKMSWNCKIKGTQTILDFESSYRTLWNWVYWVCCFRCWLKYQNNGFISKNLHKIQIQRNAEDFRLWIFLYRACESRYIESFCLDAHFYIWNNVLNQKISS